MPGGYEWIIIIAVLLLLFGAKKLPDMARSIGQSARVFKGEMKGLKDDEGPSDVKSNGATPAAGTTPATPQPLPTSTTNVTPENGQQPATPQAQPAATPQAQPAATPQAQPGRSTDAT
ncbi:MAG: Sec-independent protein translocase subunit TatA [Pseudonocardia sediminis]